MDQRPWRFIMLSSVQEVRLPSFYFSSIHGSKKWFGARTRANTHTHTRMHSECFIKLHLSSQMCLHKPRREEYRQRWRPMCFCGSSAYLWDKMETLQGDENWEWKTGGRGESVQRRVMGQTSRERETDKEAKTGIKTRAEGERDRQGGKDWTLFASGQCLSLSVCSFIWCL